MSDLNFQQISTVQSISQGFAATVASTTTIAPTTFLTIISGTTDIATITPPTTGTVMLAFVWSTSSPGSFLTTGNISVGSTTMIQNRLVLMVFNPPTNKWYMQVP